MFADLGNHLEPATVGQPEIENDEVGLFRRHRRERPGGIVGGDRAMPGGFEAGAQKATDRRLVIDDEHGIGISHAPPPVRRSRRLPAPGYGWSEPRRRGHGGFRPGYDRPAPR